MTWVVLQTKILNYHFLWTENLKRYKMKRLIILLLFIPFLSQSQIEGKTT